MLAAMLDYPFASLVDSIEVLDGGKLQVGPRDRRRKQRDERNGPFPACSRFRPALMNRAMSECEAFGKWPRWRFRPSALRSLGIAAGSVGKSAAKVRRMDYFQPALGKGAEILDGSREEVIDKVIELVRAKGGLK